MWIIIFFFHFYQIHIHLCNWNQHITRSNEQYQIYIDEIKSLLNKQVFGREVKFFEKIWFYCDSFPERERERLFAFMINFQELNVQSYNNFKQLPTTHFIIVWRADRMLHN